jgi:hypothetical protein
MVQASQPDTKDTAPPAMKKLAEVWLLDNPEFNAYLDGRACPSCGNGEPVGCVCAIPDGWLDALACDLDGALTDRLIEWVTTLKEGRPADMPVVEWHP